MFKKQPPTPPIPPAPVYTHVSREEYEKALNTLNNALHSGQFGIIPIFASLYFGPKKSELFRQFENHMSPTMYDRRALGSLYEIENLTFKTKEEMDAEKEKELLEKIARLKAEIDAKSKELADIAKARK